MSKSTPRADDPDRLNRRIDSFRQMTTLKTVAERCSLDRSAARRILRQAGIHPVVIGEGRNGSIRYYVDEIERWLASRERAP